MATLLVSKTDFVPYFQISEIGNDAKTLDPHILQAQNLDVADIIGNSMFNDLLVTINVANTKLLDGGTYVYSGVTYRFSGLKAAICHYAMARKALLSNVIDTAWGKIEKVSDFSRPVGAERIKQLSDTARSAGQKYLQECITFIECNLTNYPLYISDCNKQSSKSGFRISSVDRFNGDNYDPYHKKYGNY